ncbi:hypothetical protein H8356DRAFT_1349435 [Neocallimastix lanati (nom. inval.)]|nr:hypothetical protein H8356DRAFT_1349435 [Neocallimastix sp. JGI-2020a]
MFNVKENNGHLNLIGLILIIVAIFITFILNKKGLSSKQPEYQFLRTLNFF